MPDEPPFDLDQLWGIDLRPDPAWEEAKQRLWAMTADERRAAMYAKKLSLELCFHWVYHAAHEAPLLNGEYWFIAVATTEVAEAGDPADAATGRRRS
jgi:hypothetical protein